MQSSFLRVRMPRETAVSAGFRESLAAQSGGSERFPFNSEEQEMTPPDKDA